MRIEDIAGLSRLRQVVGRLDHDDEIRRGNGVMLFRHGVPVMRITCSTAGLAWDAERIAAGLRFRRAA